MTERIPNFDIIVVGGGHAGCEAALAAARLGARTLLLTMNISTIALMPCNPSIGGPGKGHLVREIGVLGGEMADCIDETCIQMKWLNTSKGPAVRSRRAQADKFLYRQRMISRLFNTAGLSLRQAHVTEILTTQNKVSGVGIETGEKIFGTKVIVTTGTYLESRVIIGCESWPSGPQNQMQAHGLSASLEAVGVQFHRLQTATPMRVHKNSVDMSKMKVLPGDIDAGGFLWENRLRLYEKQIPCYLTHTDERSVDAVKKNLKHSPLVLENITNVGPKHCPSIDRKIIRFPDQIVHQIFVEPEGWKSQELYLQGLTTAMPPDAQRDILESVAGLESAIILRYGYAIEYDALAPGQIRKTMESRSLSGLYTAGQINGTSGYEEAAAQGLIAGINAALAIKGQSAYWPSRTRSYIGVLVDDLSVYDKPEPYRITPGHAEFRLALRDDSAERRLLQEGYNIGLVNDKRFDMINEWITRIENESERLEQLFVLPNSENRSKLLKTGTGDLKKPASACEIMQRPGMTYSDVFKFFSDLEEPALPLLEQADEIYCLETDIKYRGYFQREAEKMKQTAFMEKIRLPVKSEDVRLQVLSEHVLEILFSDRYDDLSQVARKHCLSREELAILLAILKQPEKVNQ